MTFSCTSSSSSTFFPARCFFRWRNKWKSLGAMSSNNLFVNFRWTWNFALRNHMTKRISYLAGLWIGGAISKTSFSYKPGSTTVKRARITGKGSRFDGSVAIISINNFPIGLHEMYLYFADTPRIIPKADQYTNGPELRQGGPFRICRRRDCSNDYRWHQESTKRNPDLWMSNGRFLNKAKHKALTVCEGNKSTNVMGILNVSEIKSCLSHTGIRTRKTIRNTWPPYCSWNYKHCTRNLSEKPVSKSADPLCPHLRVLPEPRRSCCCHSPKYVRSISSWHVWCRKVRLLLESRYLGLIDTDGRANCQKLYVSQCYQVLTFKHTLTADWLQIWNEFIKFKNPPNVQIVPTGLK